MSAIYRIPIKRSAARHAAIAFTVVMLVVTGCIASGTPAEKQIIDAAQGQCVCDGTTLKCGSAEPFEGSYFCNDSALQDAGVCACSGTTLNCKYHICTQSGLLGAGNPIACTDAGQDDSAPQSKSSYQMSVSFPNSAQCADPAGGGSVSQPTARPAECQAGWLPESGCTCCGTTLTCADGTVATFNPECGVGSGTGGDVCTCVPYPDLLSGTFACQEDTSISCTP